MNSQSDQAKSKSLSPYLGIKPFRPEDKALFYGRNRETEEIISLILGYPVVLVYAQSGSGKTSIFNASIIPVLEEKYNFEVFPLTRVAGAEKREEKDRIENLYIFNALDGIESGIHQVSSPNSLLNIRLKEFLQKKYPHFSDSPQALIFDQFEEIFTFFDLNRWEKEEDTIEERKGFFDQIREALDADPLLRVIFIIREDYLARLEPFAKYLPGKLRARFRLECLTEEAAQLAVKNPVLNTTSKIFDEGVVEKLVKNLLETKIPDGVTGELRDFEVQYIEPMQLQICCLNLWKHLPETETLINKNYEIFGTPKSALRTFYDEAISRISTSEEDQDQLRKFCGDLITFNDTRGAIIENISKNYTGGLSNSMVEKLKNECIITREFRHNGYWYELIHDSLIEPIKESNSEWDQQKKQKAASRLRQLSPTMVTEKQRENLSTQYEDAIKEAVKATTVSDKQSFEQSLRTCFGEIIYSSVKTILEEIFRNFSIPNEVLTIFRNKGIISDNKLADDSWKQPILESNEKWNEEQLKQKNPAKSENENFKLSAGRENLLKNAVILWDYFSKDKSCLLRGKLLTEAVTWSEKNPDKLTELGRDFLQQSRLAEDRRNDEELQLIKEMVFFRSTQLAEYARLLQEERPRCALLLALEAYKMIRLHKFSVPSIEETVRQALTKLTESTPQKTLKAPYNYESESSVTCLAINYTSDRFIWGCDDGAIYQHYLTKLNDQSNDQPPIFYKDENAIYTVGISQNDRWLATGGRQGCACLWDLHNSNNFPIKLHGNIVAFTPDEKRLVIGGEDGVFLWQLGDYTLIPKIGPKKILSLAIGNDSRWLISGTEDNAAYLWNLEELDKLFVLGRQNNINHKKPVTCVAINSDNHWIVTTSEDSTYLWNMEMKNNELTHDPIFLGCHWGGLRTLLFTPDNKRLIAGSGGGAILIWDLNHAEHPPKVLRGHQSAIQAVDVSSDSRRLATGSEDGTICLWDMSDLDTQGCSMLKPLVG